MSRRVHRIPVILDTGDIKELPQEDGTLTVTEPLI